ncbi:ferritin-like domain-containing protein [Mucilaginibacter aquariorum]|uniref:Ferritin-like domain-containing protein n=1 Tax=Mucilaginibacter aquariorum TaxID=2967225 RepID=A0ABT1T541_9SPHI|nr:ferritin-like domain-containing protein [Mucilaginibacter aquariorum]MCQ6959746.1 ferritin-like domain-containing protein [Mucilaginibacter aquariorum]
MHTSYYWIGYFQANARHKRVNWNLMPTITQDEIAAILPSLQAWQLGETSEGEHLIAASTRYAYRLGDPDYVDAVKLFIKEEQKHGNNLGRYIDKIGQKRIKKDWGDTLFRKVRYFNTSMELWTLAVIVVESTAQIFYQALKDATHCRLLKDICTDILIDEAPHITFQTERLAIIFEEKSNFSKSWRKVVYKHFFHATSLLVWHAHKKLFMAGGVTFDMYVKKMQYKYNKTISAITAPPADHRSIIFRYEH